MADPRIAIVGAGISGLSCARTLGRRGDVVILEKSRSLGGRCATRRWRAHFPDHGAQFFTMRDPVFEAEMRVLCGDTLRQIDAPIRDGSDGSVRESIPRFYRTDGNNRLGKSMLDLAFHPDGKPG